MAGATGSDRTGPSAPDDGADTGRGAMPAWAARHLAEADNVGGAPDLTPPAPGRHRYRRGRLPDEPSRLRGWALATAAVAAAVGTVPLAVASLSRQVEPLPQVQTFPVVTPVDIGGSDPAGTGAGTAALAEPGPDAAGSLPPMDGPGDPVRSGVASPRVAPTAAARPWPASAPRAEEARIPRAQPPRRPDRPPSTSVTPTTDPDAPADPDPREDDGGGTVTEPRESTPTTTTTTTTTTPSPSSRGRHAADPDDEAPPRQPGLLGSTVREVSGLLH